MNNLFGTFSECTSLAQGDPYKRPKDAVGRFAGKQMSTQPPKSGRAPDVFLDKTTRSLALGDRYLDAWILEKRLSRIPGKAVCSKPFQCRVGAASTSMSCGPGSNDGCLSAVPLDTDGSTAAARSNTVRAEKLRNIYTTAPKTGGFGRPWRDMTLGEPPKYYSDAYEGGRERERELRRSAKPVGAKPFVAVASHAGRPFTPDGQLYGAGASSSSASPGTSRRCASAPRERRPWRPSSPPKHGGAFAVAAYVPDPVREAKFHAHVAAAVRPFRPVSGTKQRLSMWAPNPFAVAPRPAPDIDFTLA